MGRRGRYQGQADAIPLGLVAEGLPLPFLASKWSCFLVLTVTHHHRRWRCWNRFTGLVGGREGLPQTGE